jgi:hypothetical protein
VRATFNSLVDGFVAWFVDTFYNDMVALVSGLNSLASGTAYSIPYKFSTATADADPGIWYLRLDNLTQNASAVIRVSTTGSNGKSYATILDTLDDSTSAVKGSLTLQSMSDPSKFLQFNVTGLIGTGSYRNITVAGTGGSATSPFTADDGLVLKFSRTGDKGDVGPMQTFPTIYVRAEHASGTSPGSVGAAATWTTRTLNTVKSNSITGASLASNAVTLPAGTYEYEGSAPAQAVNGHQTQLYNVTDSAVIDMGTSEYASNASSGANRSVLRGQFVLASAKAVAIRHWTVAAVGTYGIAASTGSNEVYAEIRFRKIA